MRLLDLMEPEETVGNLWHDIASGIGADLVYPDAGVALADVRPSLSVLFRALGGPQGVELGEAPATLMEHRRPLHRKLGTERERHWIASFDGERLNLPPLIAAFPEAELNRAAYFWLTALAANADIPDLTLLNGSVAFDCAQIRLNASAATAAYATCPGLRILAGRMTAHCIAARPKVMRPAQETQIEAAICDQLGGKATLPDVQTSPRGYLPFAPIPIWLRFTTPGSGASAAVNIYRNYEKGSVLIFDEVERSSLAEFTERNF